MTQHTPRNGRSTSRALERLRETHDEIPLADRIRTCSRLRTEDKPVFAANLGRLAAMVDEADPLEGARKITERSGIDGVWAKRKRHFRLPGEPVPPAAKDSAYASSASTFVKLAETAGKIIAQSSNPELVELQTRKAVNLLAAGSSFLPVWTPSAPGDLTAKGLLDEFASRLADKVRAETRLTDLWSVLNDTPIDLTGLEASELADLDPSPFGAAADWPAELLQPHFRETVVAARLKPGGSRPYWADPSLEIGRVTYARHVPMLVVPADRRAWLALDSLDNLSSRAADWLNSRGFGQVWPDEDGDLDHFDESLGWAMVTVWSTLKVSLSITRGDDDEPRVSIGTFGDPLLAVGDGAACGSVGSNMAEIIAGEGNIAQHTVGYFSDDDEPISSYISADLVHARPFRTDSQTRPPVIGILQGQWSLLAGNPHTRIGTSGWTESTKVADFLIGGDGTFEPTLPGCEPVSGPLREGSVGAALLHNALTATPENRIATLLTKRARLTADTGLRFHEAMVETYRDAIRRL